MILPIRSLLPTIRLASPCVLVAFILAWSASRASAQEWVVPDDFHQFSGIPEESVWDVGHYDSEKGGDFSPYTDSRKLPTGNSGILETPTFGVMGWLGFR